MSSNDPVDRINDTINKRRKEQSERERAAAALATDTIAEDLWGTYAALTAKGFTADQAFAIVLKFVEKAGQR